MGTHVFDAFGSASLKSLQTPDEVVMFCVDISPSMGDASDFSEVNEVSEPRPAEVEAPDIVEGELFSQVSFDDAGDSLSKYESFDDLVAFSQRLAKPQSAA